MSAAALQRVVVRLMHDPDLERATRGAGLTQTERGWLAAVDPRRWRADGLRRSRLLQALIEEHPVSAALTARAAGVPALDAFFQSAAFHQSVQARRVLALDFGRWLMASAPPGVAHFAQIEHAIARVRRCRPSSHPPDPMRRWRRAPWIAIGRGPLEAWHRLRAQLAAHPEGMLGGILDPALGIDVGVTTPAAWMVDGSGPPQVEALPDALFAALHALRAPLPWPDCLRALCRAGAEPEDADAVLRGLIEDVLLTVAAD